MTWKIDVGINIAHLQFFPVLFDLADDNLWWHHLNPWSTCSLLVWQPKYIVAQLLAMKLSINQKKKKIDCHLSATLHPISAAHQVLPTCFHICFIEVHDAFFPVLLPGNSHVFGFFACQYLEAPLMMADVRMTSRQHRPGACCSGVALQQAAADRRRCLAWGGTGKRATSESCHLAAWQQEQSDSC